MREVLLGSLTHTTVTVEFSQRLSYITTAYTAAYGELNMLCLKLAHGL